MLSSSTASGPPSPLGKANENDHLAVVVMLSKFRKYIDKPYKMVYNNSIKQKGGLSYREYDSPA